MKKITYFTIGAFAVISAFSSTANAQNSSNAPNSYFSNARLSIGIDAGLPIGSLNDSYNWTFGGSVQGDFPILTDRLFVTVNTGFYSIFSRNDSHLANIHIVPAKAGLKFFIVKQVYIQGEAGAAFLTNNTTVSSNNSTVFVYAPQAGVLLNIGGNNYIDAGVRFESNSSFASGGNHENFLALRVSYALKL
ncbi:MAG: hypothetical protein JWQ66_571 [Mucilaginibacter sp.]|nr:hypothetical protein [Mucilaginibacter sp.]